MLFCSGGAPTPTPMSARTKWSLHSAIYLRKVPSNYTPKSHPCQPSGVAQQSGQAIPALLPLKQKQMQEGYPSQPSQPTAVSDYSEGDGNLRYVA